VNPRGGASVVAFELWRQGPAVVILVPRSPSHAILPRA